MTDPNNPRGPDNWPPSWPGANGQISPTQMLYDVWSGQQRLMSDSSGIKDHLREGDRNFHRLEIEIGRRMDRIEGAVSTLKHTPASASLPAPPPPASPSIGGWEVALKRPVPWIILLLALLITGKLEVVIRFIEALAKFAEHAS